MSSSLSLPQDDDVEKKSSVRDKLLETILKLPIGCCLLVVKTAGENSASDDNDDCASRRENIDRVRSGTASVFASTPFGLPIKLLRSFQDILLVILFPRRSFLAGAAAVAMNVHYGAHAH